MVQKLKAYFAEHEAVLQFVKFTLISMIAGASETVSFLILSNVLPAVGVNSEINWFVFRYAASAGGLGALIAFLVSATIGQVISFVVNFKKNFNSTNNVVASAIGYAVMAILIIVGLNTYVGGLLNDALCNVIPNNALASFLAKVVCMMASFFIVFPMNKFVIMRNDGKKKSEDNSISLDEKPIVEEIFAEEKSATPAEEKSVAPTTTEK